MLRHLDTDDASACWLALTKTKIYVDLRITKRLLKHQFHELPVAASSTSALQDNDTWLVSCQCWSTGFHDIIITGDR